MQIAKVGVNTGLIWTAVLTPTRSRSAISGGWLGSLENDNLLIKRGVSPIDSVRYPTLPTVAPGKSALRRMCPCTKADGAG